jgi:hypothetical protein
MIKVFGKDFPRKSCAITALLAGKERIWGGVSGENAALFTWDIDETNQITPSEAAPNMSSLISFFQQTNIGQVRFVQRLPDMSSIIALFPYRSAVIGVAAAKRQKGGCIFRCQTNGQVQKLSDLPEGHVPIASAWTRQRLLILTQSGMLTEYAIGSWKSGRTAQIPSNDLSPILVAKGKKVYGCVQNGQIFVWNFSTRKARVLDVFIPAAKGRQYEAQWQSLTLNNGMIYGGSSDGYLFSLNPETDEIINLGKPLHSMGMPAMVTGADGAIYGAGGRGESPTHIFRYHPKKGFKDLGALYDVGLWSTFSVGCMTASPDGSIYIGEKDDLSHLWNFSVK